MTEKMLRGMREMCEKCMKPDLLSLSLSLRPPPLSLLYGRHRQTRRVQAWRGLRVQPPSWSEKKEKEDKVGFYSRVKACCRGFWGLKEMISEGMKRYAIRTFAISLIVEFSHRTNGRRRSYENGDKDRRHRRLKVGSLRLDGSAPDRAIGPQRNISFSRFFEIFNQAVVASLPSDPNVWNVVMENPTVYRFFESHSGNYEKVEKLSTFSSEGDETLEKMEATAESDLRSMFFDFMGFLQNIFSSPDSSKEAIGVDSEYGKLGERIPIPFGGG
ncbi:hypothetical protein V8G54_031338 [Vigna mungo]|uniref:Uncharacterized protein n=1 Tax=Vigna mungo TaxID=3915 RepID=A0AAQ3MY42_VIGMU